MGTDKELLAALEAAGGATEAPAAIHARAGQHIAALRHWRAIGLLGEARRAAGPGPFDRMLALALGGQAELMMRWADGLGVTPPPDLVADALADLGRAVEIDPTLADPFWDLAVIHARFEGDRARARERLDEARALGYAHPMMAPLDALIASGAAPPPDPPWAPLGRAVLRLALQVYGPLSDALTDEGESDPRLRAPTDPPRSFGDHVQAAVAAARGLDAAAWSELAARCRMLPGDAREYAADLLRRAAGAAPPAARAAAATFHLAVLRDMVQSHVTQGEATRDDVWMRRAVRAADRALAIVDGAAGAADPDVHADLLLARGTALWRIDRGRVLDVLRCYRQALDLKREAGNHDDVARLVQLTWRQIDWRIGEAEATLAVGGFGGAIETLAAFADAADALDDPQRALGVRLHLAGAQRRVGLYREAEANLRRIEAEAATPALVEDARFELASVLSETRRPAEALEIQRALLDATAGRDGYPRAMLLSNMANSLRLLGRLEEAHDTLDAAWELLPEDERRRGGDAVPLRGLRIRMLQAQVESALGDHERAAAMVAEAEALNPNPVGVDGLRQLGVASQVLLDADRRTPALAALERADHLLRFMLESRPSLPAWESMLGEWSRLDARAVCLLAEDGAAGDTQASVGALLRAEAAKGRVTAWLGRRGHPEQAGRALDPARQELGLSALRAWQARAPGRHFVSLFATDQGLGICHVGDGGVTATWLDDFCYETFRTDVFEPWERLVETALATGEPDAVRLSGALLDHFLDRVGGWIARAAPGLAAGGTELLVSPHRLFRNLPLLHARLPSGARLGDLFGTIRVVPGLADLADAPAGRAQASGVPGAFADPDGSLPFARCEALLAAEPGRRLTGAAATRAGLADLLALDGPLLLSSHGDFREEDPFGSVVQAADGAYSLADLMLSRSPVAAAAAFLGVCESGRSRRSVSDEPIGFPVMLLQLGVRTVVAPCWQVDDFAAFLWMTRFCDAVEGGAPVAPAVAATARWLRDLTASDVRDRVDRLVARLEAAGAEGRAALAAVSDRLAAQRAWLDGLDRAERPFRSPLDWAAWQVTGAPEDMGVSAAEEEEGPGHGR